MIVFSDVHGHRGPLASLLEGWSGPFVCAGDVLGSGGDNEGCLALLRRHEVSTVAGNHEQMPIYPLAADSRCWVASLPRVVRQGEVAVTHTLIEKGYYREVERPERAEALLEELPARVVFIGHTHLPGWWSEGRFHPAYGCESFRPAGRIVVNVGSLGEPRPPQRPSFVRYADQVVAFGRL